jgi:hypothetical protein
MADGLMVFDSDSSWKKMKNFVWQPWLRVIIAVHCPTKDNAGFRRWQNRSGTFIQFLGGILRLACACDREHDTHIARLEVESAYPVLRLRAQGYAETTAFAEHLAAARHLLELACQRPVFIVPAAAHSAGAS